MNETISKWLGECRHEGVIKLADLGSAIGNHFWCPDCGLCTHWHEYFSHHKAPDYENDPGAWTQELYGKIAEQELDFISVFTSELKQATIGHRIASLTSRHAMKFIRATPAQKAQALARAITEMERTTPSHKWATEALTKSIEEGQ